MTLIGTWVGDAPFPTVASFEKRLTAVGRRAYTRFPTSAGPSKRIGYSIESLFRKKSLLFGLSVRTGPLLKIYREPVVRRFSFSLEFLLSAR